MGCRPIRRLIAEALLPFALASSQRPKRMRAMIITDASKYTGGRSPSMWSCALWAPAKGSGQKVTIVL